jgi:CheY-like chemotaxis protein
MVSMSVIAILRQLRKSHAYDSVMQSRMYPKHLIDAGIRLEHALEYASGQTVSSAKEGMSLTILIVDDSPHIRAYVRTSIAANTDWTVCEAENGEIALTMVVGLKPHFVVLDLSMPGMNGLETARRISAISPGLPMIMFTMHESRMLEKEAHAAGI